MLSGPGDPECPAGDPAGSNRCERDLPGRICGVPASRRDRGEHSVRCTAAGLLPDQSAESHPRCTEMQHC